MEKDSPSESTPPPTPPATPLSWRVAVIAAVVTLGLVAFLTRDWITPRGQAAAGVVCFLGIAAACSTNLRAVNGRTLAWGFALQFGLALFVTRLEFGRRLFFQAGQAVKKFLEFSTDGSRLVFGVLAEPEAVGKVFPGKGFIFAFTALPTIIFVSSFFSILYYFGVLQRLVGAVARVMRYLMQTSGAETVSVTANVFMGQTEAPLIVKPYVPLMTRSELLALMVGGMAHISGALMAVYIGMGADPVAILTTSVMASPCSLYMTKLVLPELERPVTGGDVRPSVEKTHANVIDAAAAGAFDGLHLALNVVAMLIAFIGLVSLVNFLLGRIPGGQTLWSQLTVADPGFAVGNSLLTLLVAFVLVLFVEKVIGLFRIVAHSSRQRCIFRSVGLFGGVLAIAIVLPWLPRELSLQRIFSWVFSPVAFLMGLSGADVPLVADFLGIKLVLNEFVAFTEYQRHLAELSPRAQVLATYALTGFANVASVGIQIGGIGSMAPGRRSDLARLGGLALFVGFLVTLVNASLAGVLITESGR
jgi:CNT family concentrative nucleoside transporter